MSRPLSLPLKSKPNILPQKPTPDKTEKTTQRQIAQQQAKLASQKAVLRAQQSKASHLLSTLLQGRAPIKNLIHQYSALASRFDHDHAGKTNPFSGALNALRSSLDPFSNMLNSVYSKISSIELALNSAHQQTALLNQQAVVQSFMPSTSNAAMPVFGNSQEAPIKLWTAADILTPALGGIGKDATLEQTLARAQRLSRQQNSELQAHKQKAELQGGWLNALDKIQSMLYQAQAKSPYTSVSPQQVSFTGTPEPNLIQQELTALREQYNRLLQTSAGNGATLTPVESRGLDRLA